MNLKVKRGCTLQSGKIFSVNEVVPKNITYAQLMEGVAEGTYTLKPLADKTYVGQIRDRANANLLAELVFDTEDDMLSFSVPASVTATWPNKENTFFYDVHETDTITGVKIMKVEGKIDVIPSITIED